MAFSRKFLLDHGVPEDQVDAIMAERNRTLNDYIPKSDLQQQIDDAVQKAKKEAPGAIDVRETEEYKELAKKLAKTEAFSSEAFAKVKPKFREDVWAKLDHEKPYDDQIPGLAEQYAEYFDIPDPQTDPEPAKPQFGSADKGSMPKGTGGKSLFDLWGFGNK